MNIPDDVCDDMDLLIALSNFEKKIELAAEAAQIGDLSNLDYTPEEFAEELSYNFLTPPEKILKYLKEKTLTYKRFATILMGRSNVAALKKAGYLDENVHLTSKGFDFVVEAIKDAEKEE